MALKILSICAIISGIVLFIMMRITNDLNNPAGMIFPDFAMTILFSIFCSLIIMILNKNDDPDAFNRWEDEHQDNDY